MKWNKFTLKTRSEVEDIVISTLADVGIEGVEIQDKQPLTESDKQQMFVDIMPDIQIHDIHSYMMYRKNRYRLYFSTERRFWQVKLCLRSGKRQNGGGVHMV